MPCRYFGHGSSTAFRVLMPTHGNQCALIRERFAPCYMAMDGHAPNLEECKMKGTGREIEMSEYRSEPHKFSDRGMGELDDCRRCGLDADDPLHT